MEIREPERRTPESIVPMINVVFLLLVFFLMTATIAPPEPFEVTPPESSAEVPAEVDRPLFVGPDGRIAWGEQGDDAAILALSEAKMGQAGGPPLVIRADRDVPGVEVAQLLARLAEVGISNSQLVAAPAR
jgi:biopolymer transport protein ExbD